MNDGITLRGFQHTLRAQSIDKADIKRVRKDGAPPIIKMKTIKVSEKNWERLMEWRVKFRCKNLDEIIERILKIVPISELKESSKK